MPQEGRCKLRSLVFGIRVCIDDMDVLQAGLAGNGSRGMLVELSEVLPKLALCIDVKICLISEEHHTPSSDQPGQLVFLGITEFSEVDPMNLGPNLGIVVENVGSIGKEIVELRVTLKSLFTIWYLS